jgi:hypothetical protein
MAGNVAKGREWQCPNPFAAKPEADMPNCANSMRALSSCEFQRVPFRFRPYSA